MWAWSDGLVGRGAEYLLLGVRDVPVEGRGVVGYLAVGSLETASGEESQGGVGRESVEGDLRRDQMKGTPLDVQGRQARPADRVAAAEAHGKSGKKRRVCFRSGV